MFTLNKKKSKRMETKNILLEQSWLEADMRLTGDLLILGRGTWKLLREQVR